MDDENDKQESAHTPVRVNGDSRGNRRLSFAGSQPLLRDEQISAAGILIAIACLYRATVYHRSFLALFPTLLIFLRLLAGGGFISSKSSTHSSSCSSSNTSDFQDIEHYYIAMH